jgi:hypothetical protein
MLSVMLYIRNVLDSNANKKLFCKQQLSGTALCQGSIVLSTLKSKLGHNQLGKRIKKKTKKSSKEISRVQM